jgi:predicted dehydrogenase
MGSFHAKHAAKYGDVLRIDTILDQSKDEQRDLLGAADVAIIASPTNTHKDWALATTEREIPTLIEKPVAASRYDAGVIKRAADFNNVPVHVGYLNRFNPAWHVFAGRIDGPGRFWANRSGRLVGMEYGGVGLDLATHDIDLIYQRWPDADITATVRTKTVYQLEISVPSENVSGRVTARYDTRKDAGNLRDWTWVGDDGQFLFADLTRQFVRSREKQAVYGGDQVDLQLQDWLTGGYNTATLEEGIRNMEVL